MKIAIYTIAKDEEKFAERFMDSCNLYADSVTVGLSPSQDRTAEILQDHGATVIPICVDPWRFDMARNVVLSCLPTDIDLCIALDLDEVLVGNWREPIEQHFRPGAHTRLKFRYIHSFKADGGYGTVGYKDFAHQRAGYEWRHTVHENLYWTGASDESMATAATMVCEHRQDSEKSRVYTELMERECTSPTGTDRHLFWLAREYVYAEAWGDVLDTAHKYLTTYPDAWCIERSNAHGYMARAYEALGQPAEALAAYMTACHVAPNQREPWLVLSQYHMKHEMWPQAYGAVCQALVITARPQHYMTRDEAWDYHPHDLAGLIAFKMELTDRMQRHLLAAVQLAPDNEVLVAKAKRLGVKLED